MVNALIQISEETNRVVNTVKAAYDLNDKSQAIEFIVKKYIELTTEPELQQNFVEKMTEIQKQTPLKVSDIQKRYNL